MFTCSVHLSILFLDRLPCVWHSPSDVHLRCSSGFLLPLIPYIKYNIRGSNVFESKIEIYTFWGTRNLKIPFSKKCVCVCVWQKSQKQSNLEIYIYLFKGCDNKVSVKITQPEVEVYRSLWQHWRGDLVGSFMAECFQPAKYINVMNTVSLWDRGYVWWLTQEWQKQLMMFILSDCTWLVNAQWVSSTLSFLSTSTT